MAKYSNTKAKINEKIATNGRQAVTGAILNDVLQTMVDSLGADYQFGGLVQPGSSFTAGEQPVVFLATTPGTYTNFGGLVVADGEVALLVWSGTAWNKQTPDIATRAEVSQLGQDLKENYGDYIDNPEWVMVVVDRNEKVLYGVMSNGQFYFGAGCPEQIKEYINSVLSGKVDKVPGESLIDEIFAISQSSGESTEWFNVITDSTNKIIEGISKDGIKKINIPTEVEGVNVKGSIVSLFAKEELYPLVQGDFTPFMTRNELIEKYNSKIASYCALCKCVPGCMEVLAAGDTDESLYEKINRNFRKDVVKSGMSKEMIASQLNKYFLIPIYRFSDIKLNTTGNINESIVVEPFNSDSFEPSALISDDGQKIELYNECKSRSLSEDGITWAEPTPLVLTGGDHHASHPSTNKVDGVYIMVGSSGDYLDLYTSSDGINFTYRGHLFQANTDIVANIDGVDRTCLYWGNSYLFKNSNGEYYLYYECYIRAWEICLATCTDLFVDRGNGFIGNWEQCSINPIIPRVLKNGSVWERPGNPEIVKGLDNRPLRHNGRYYMYYHSISNSDDNPIFRAYSEDLVHWVTEGKIFDNRDIPTYAGGTNSDHALCEFKGRSYMFYTHNINLSSHDYTKVSIRQMCDDRPLLELLKIRA